MGCRLLLAFLSVIGVLLAGRLVAAVDYDAKIPQLAFAAQELNAAQAEAGREELQVTLTIHPDEVSPESFEIRRVAAHRVEVVGSDPTGAMYGGLEDDGKFVFRDMSADAIVWKTFSKDEAGPHWAEFRKGQLKTYRGTPGDRDVSLWESRKLQDEIKGPFKFGITQDKRVTVFRSDDGEVKFIWKSPSAN